MKASKIGSIVLTLGIVGGLALAPFCLERIQAGYVGLVYNMNGGISDKTLSQGWHGVLPTQKVSKYSVATEQAFLSKDKQEGSPDDDSFDIPTSDGKLVNVDLEFSYHFDAEMLPETYTRFKGQSGEDIEKTFVRGKIKAWSAEVSSRFSVLEVYGEKRADLNKAVYGHVKDKFAEYGIVIDSVNFSRIGLDEQTAKAVQDRVNAMQDLEKVKIEKDKAQLEADRKIIEAKGIADSELIKAEGQSKANEKLQQSLTKELVELKKTEKWDGKLPVVSGSNAIIDMDNLQPEAKK